LYLLLKIVDARALLSRELLHSLHGGLQKTIGSGPKLDDGACPKTGRVAVAEPIGEIGTEHHGTDERPRLVG